MTRFPKIVVSLFSGVLLSAISALNVQAGGGPENVLLVVNAASWASKTVANHYVELRKIPSSNLVYLNWDGGLDTIDVNAFREKILGPTLQEIERRGLSDQIDYVLYSSDFPTAIDLRPDLHGQAMPDVAGTSCSLTSATYFYGLIMARNSGIIALKNNNYMRTPDREEPRPATHGFRSWYGWGPRGELMEAGAGQHYLLSAMLAVTSGRGNSVGEAENYLRVSAKADGTHPRHTVYFTESGDRRVKARSDDYDFAIAQLKQRGVAAALVKGDMPTGKRDVLGATTGVANFSWRDTGSTILPGAICDNLTSYGGAMTESAGQTPLTEFLRYGAAGSSGTVVEPYVTSPRYQPKFPAPTVHAQYASGCTLAEAFYQSVFGPYQLLIVGDALCRPWANIPQVQVDELKAGAKLSGTITLKPTATVSGGAKVDRFELFVDGRQAVHCAAGETLVFDTHLVCDGYHELRVVAVESSPIESQGRFVAPIWIDNHQRAIEFTASPERTVRWNERLKLAAKVPGMAGVLFLHNGRLLGKAAGEAGEIEVDPQVLGSGPVVIEAQGIARGGPLERVAAQPIRLTVKPGPALPAIKAPAKLLAGMQLKLANGKSVIVQETYNHDWLTVAGAQPRETFELTGYFEAPAAEVYQFQVQYYGDLKVVVDGQTLLDGRGGAYEQKFLPVPLAAGFHRLVLTGRASERAQVRIFFGGPGALSLKGDRFRHAG